VRRADLERFRDRTSTNNQIVANSIHDNGSPAILVVPSASPSPPNLTSVTSSGTATEIKGVIFGAPNTNYGLQFFANPATDPFGYAEGRTLLGSMTFVTDGNGRFTFDEVLPVSVAIGEYVTSTAMGQILGFSTV